MRRAEIWLWLWAALSASQGLAQEPQPQPSRLPRALDGWGNWQLLEENDTFAAPGQGSDEFYTQGLRLVFTREPESTWKWVEKIGDWWGGHLFYKTTQFRTLSSLVIGENHFTPGVITTYEPDPADRPFASVLYGGVRIDMVAVSGRSLQSVEFDLGLLGPLGLGAPLQKGFHTLRQHRIPKGWPEQLSTEPMVAAIYQNRRQYGVGTREGHILDVTRDFGLNLGTLQTYPTAGATVRLGYRMSGMPTGTALFAVAEGTRPNCNGKPCPFEFGVFAGADVRYLLRNGYYDGSLIGGPPSVDKERFVYDLRYGAYARWHSWRLSYTAVRRSREFSPVPAASAHPEGRHEFGSIALGREFVCPCTTKPDAEKPFFTRDWLFEFGLGAGSARLDPEATGGRTTNGPAGHFGFAKGVTSRLMLGAEISGVTREGEQNVVTDIHDDTFLTTKALVVSVRPFGKHTGPGVLRLKAGLGQAEAKVEITRAGEAIREDSETGFAWNIGAAYTARVGDQLSLGLDATYGHLSVNKVIFGHASFLSTTVVAQWHP